MRDYLNAILSFIGSESLTDEEFESITLEDTNDQVANYEALLSVLESRESVSGMLYRLQYYYLAQGVIQVAQIQSHPAMSNIFVGAPLE